MTLTKEARAEISRQNMAKARAARGNKPKAEVIPGTVPLPAVMPHPANDNGHNGTAMAVSPVSHETAPKDMANFRAAIESLDVFKNTFQSSQGASGLTMLGDPGDDVGELPMRSNFPSMQAMIACSDAISACRKYHYDEGLKQMLFVVAGYCCIHGERAKQIVEAIIGELRKKGMLNDAKPGFVQQVKDEIMK